MTAGAPSEERLAALLDSPFAERIFRERDEEIAKQRQAHADAIAATNKAELAARMRCDKEVDASFAALEAMRAGLAAAQIAYNDTVSKRNNEIALLGRARELHEIALRDTAPAMVDEFFHWLREAYDASLKRNTKPVIQSVKTRNAGDLRKTATILTTKLAAERQRGFMLAAIRGIDDLRLEPNISKIAEKIAHIRGEIESVNILELTTIESDTAYLASGL